MNPQELQAIRATALDGDKPFLCSGSALDFNVSDFWRWSGSDLLSNTSRGIVAEYLVAQALGLTDKVRLEWDPVDLVTPSGLKIEVKSSAYLQMWDQKDYSAVQFGISPTRGWNPELLEWSQERKRQADLYVFCLLHHRDKVTVQVLDVAQWTFFLVCTHELNTKKPESKTLSLTALRALNHIECQYHDVGRSFAQLEPQCKGC